MGVDKTSPARMCVCLYLSVVCVMRSVYLCVSFVVGSVYAFLSITCLRNASHFLQFFDGSCQVICTHQVTRLRAGSRQVPELSQIFLQQKKMRAIRRVTSGRGLSLSPHAPTNTQNTETKHLRLSRLAHEENEDDKSRTGLKAWPQLKTIFAKDLLQLKLLGIR